MGTGSRPRPDRPDRREAQARPPRPRRRPKRARVPAVVALVAVLAALLAGMVIGYVAADDPGPAGLVTQERTVPVVTVTVPAEPEG